MLARERAPATTRGALPAPARLPSLPDALARRAAVFGPYNGEPEPVVPVAPDTWTSLGEAAARALRSLADVLDPRGRA